MRRTLLGMALLLLSAAAVAGTITRGIKSGTGSTDFGSGATILSSEFNTDFNTIYNEFNGSIADANVGASANIDPSKIGDYSANAAEQDNESSPGSVGSESLPTTLEGELERLRYALSRLSGYVNAQRENGSGLQQVPWIEAPMLGENLIRNASFGTVSDAVTGLPDGWSAVGTVVSSVADAATVDGFGLHWTIAPTLDAEGVTYTLGELRGSTNYLIVVRAAETSGNAVLSTTGADATSVFRDPSIALSGASQTTYSFVVRTDATPTDVVLKALCSGGACQVRFTHIGAYELGTEPLRAHRQHSLKHAGDITDNTNCSAGVTDVPTDITATVYVPPGHAVKINVDGDMHASVSASKTILLGVERGTTNLGGDVLYTTDTTGFYYSWGFTRIDTSPAVGNNTYTLNCTVSAGVDYILNDSAITLEVIPLD